MNDWLMHLAREESNLRDKAREKLASNLIEALGTRFEYVWYEFPHNPLDTVMGIEVVDRVSGIKVLFHYDASTGEVLRIDKVGGWS